VKPKAKVKMSGAPLALASDGTILVNAVEFDVKVNIDLAFEHAKMSGLPVFVGVVVPMAEVSKFTKHIDDSAADLAGHLG
jgi:hypothetical protein